MTCGTHSSNTAWTASATDNYRRHPLYADLVKQSLTPDIAVHVTPAEVVVTAGLAESMLDGKAYLFGNQVFRVVANERAMVRETGWASRPVKLWDER